MVKQQLRRESNQQFYQVYYIKVLGSENMISKNYMLIYSGGQKSVVF